MAARILFLHHNAIVGGAELHLLALVRHFRDRARVLLFADGPFRKMLERTGVEVRVAPSSWATSGVRGGEPRFTLRNFAEVFRLAWRTAQIARDADLIYANSPRALLVASVARLVRRRPVLWFLHDLLDENHFSRRGVQLLVRRANRTATRILANSRASADAFVAAGGNAELLRVVYCGVEIPQTVPPPGRKTIGIFGRITRWKGQDVVVRALAQVPEVCAIFVGEEEDREYANELRRLADNRVRFLGFREDVRELMSEVDCIVHVSTAPEPFGRVIVEGMLAQRPVIATDAGGVREIIENGVSGLLVRPGNTDELADAIQRVFANPAESGRMAARGRERAIAMFSEERMLREIEQHVSDLSLGK